MASHSEFCGSRGGLAQQGLELGERHLDGIEIGRIGRQVEKDGAPGFDRGADACDFVRGEIVNHDDVALRQARGQHRLDIDQDALRRSLALPERRVRRGRRSVARP